MRPNKALQTDKDKLSCLLHSQKPRQLTFAAELGRQAALVGGDALGAAIPAGPAAPPLDIPYSVYILYSVCGISTSTVGSSDRSDGCP